MIIDRITAIRAIQPKLVLTEIPVARVSRDVVTTRVVGTGERQVSEGTSGTILDVSYDEVEIDLYSPRDVLVFAQRAHYRPA